MTKEEFTTIIKLGREQRSVEFKGPGLRTDRHLFAKVTRAVLGMANSRNGGKIIIGIEEGATALNLSGMTPDEMTSWKYDDVANGFAEYADPNVQFDTRRVEHEAKTFLVIAVEEFAEVPVVCKKDYNTGKDVILRTGACYVRPRRKPETVEVSTYADMRDLIDLATEKSLRRFISQAQTAGIQVGARRESSDEDLFNAQAETFQ